MRGGNSKFRALRLDSGNFSWGSEVRHHPEEAFVCLATVHLKPGVGLSRAQSGPWSRADCHSFLCRQPPGRLVSWMSCTTPPTMSWYELAIVCSGVADMLLMLMMLCCGGVG